MMSQMREAAVPITSPIANRSQCSNSWLRALCADADAVTRREWSKGTKTRKKKFQVKVWENIAYPNFPSVISLS